MSFAARCRSSALAAALCVFAAACGGDTTPPLATKPLPNTPTGPLVALTYRTEVDVTYVAAVIHSLKVEGGASAPDVQQIDDQESWIVHWQATSPTAAEFRLFVEDPKAPEGDLIEKRSLDAFIETSQDHWTVRTVSRSVGLYRVLTDPGLAGLGGVGTWLPGKPVQVGATWPLPHFFDATTSDLPAGMTPSEEATVRLESIDDDGAWHLRIEARLALSGTMRGDEGRADVQIVDRIRGTAEIDAAFGQPRRFHLTAERSEIESGQRVRSATRELRGSVRRVETSAAAPK